MSSLTWGELSWGTAGFLLGHKLLIALMHYLYMYTLQCDFVLHVLHCDCIGSQFFKTLVKAFGEAVVVSVAMTACTAFEVQS